MREVFLENGKSLRVYDNVFPLGFRASAFEFAISSNFVIGWSDGVTDAQTAHKYLHSSFSHEDVARLGIVDQIRRSEAANELDGFEIKKTILNLTTASDVHFVHTHCEDKVLLYYVNLSWNDGWHGETLFLDDASKDVIFASQYTPGRLIAFPGDTPHAIRPQSIIADKHRFSLALFLTKC